MLINAITTFCVRSYITAIGTANPDFCFKQEKIAEFMIRNIPEHPAWRRKFMALYKASGIDTRYTVIPDFGTTPENYRFFPPTANLEPFPDVRKRMILYEKEASVLGARAAVICLKKGHVYAEEITHLITVSCTGMYAPGMDIELVEQLNLNHSVNRTCINFMGCYAAFNAIKAADAFCKADPANKVLIVGVELCTLHYQKNTDWDYILSNALFGDGAAAVLVEGVKGPTCSLSLDLFKSFLVPQGKKDMAWHISNFGFEMSLSSYIPDLIRSGIKDFCAELSDDLDAAIDYYAIHPGGKGILEAVESSLNIEREKNRWAWGVLKDHGNMSSVTVLYVLQKLMESITDSRREGRILTMAFGPGLTVETGVLTAHVQNVAAEVPASNFNSENA